MQWPQGGSITGQTGYINLQAGGVFISTDTPGLQRTNIQDAVSLVVQTHVPGALVALCMMPLVLFLGSVLDSHDDWVNVICPCCSPKVFLGWTSLESGLFTLSEPVNHSREPGQQQLQDLQQLSGPCMNDCRLGCIPIAAPKNSSPSLELCHLQSSVFWFFRFSFFLHFLISGALRVT